MRTARQLSYFFTALLMHSVIFPLPIQAADLRLQLQQQEDQLNFNYQFKINGQPQQLAFSLSKNVVANHFREFRPLKPALMQQYLWRDMQKLAGSFPGVRLQRLPGRQALNYRISAGDQAQRDELQQQLTELIQNRRREYLQQAYYHEIRWPDRQRVIVPDHQRLMQDSLQDLLPVATALHASVLQMEVRQAINFIAQWIQQIPYQDLSDRLNSSGASFSPPLRLLRENRGDCDSKAVLLASLIRMLLPDLKLAMVYLPNHAVLAIQMTPSQSDMTVTIGAASYILIDATGPALLPPGEISPEYRPFTQSGAFAYQLL